MKDKKPKEKYNHWFPKRINVWAVVVGNTIFYSMGKQDINNKLRSHEEKHIEQYKRHGIPKFLILYFYYYLKGRLKGKSHYQSYLNIPFEVEARHAEKYK